MSRSLCGKCEIGRIAVEVMVGLGSSSVWTGPHGRETMDRMFNHAGTLV